MSNNYLLLNNQEIILKHQTTIGRSPNNTIHISDNSVSKNHAVILTFKQNKTYICDLNSVNGTLVNGVKVNNNENIELKNNDAIQFGRHEALYIFKERYPVPVGKKINLKDYYFEQVQTNAVKPQRQINSSSKQVNIQKQGKKQQRLKIPDLSDFLIEKKQQQEHKGEFVKKRKGQGKIELSSLNNLLKDNSSELEMNMYLKQQEENKKYEDYQRKIKQQALKMEIQRNQKEELLLRKQLETEKRLREEQQKINEDRKRVQDQINERIRLQRQEQENNKFLLQKKEQEFIEKLKKEKDRQIAQLKKQDEQTRIHQEQAIKTDYARRKKELQLEAEGLARQYQTIYRQTINKVKEDITREQNAIQNSEQLIQQLVKESHQLNTQVQRNSRLSQQLNHNYMIINSKNKALILYASELQNRIDKLKQQAQNVQYKNKNKAKYKELKQMIVNCRKMLNIKKHQKNNLINEVKNLKISIMGMDGYSEKIQDYLENVLQKNEQIAKIKEQYYEYIQQQKNLEALWEMDLSVHDQLLQQQKGIELQIQSNSKTLKQTLLDNLKKLAEQHLHALKLIQPFITDQKRKAAKYLIEQMVNIQKEFSQISCEKEQIHLQINKIITQSEHFRRQNQYLSQLLFGEGTIHHFDNMKIIINELVEKIDMYRDGGGVRDSIKLGQEILKIQEGIEKETQKLRQLKNEQKKYISNGNRVFKMNQKNPINFFGEELAKKDLAINNYDNSIKSHKNQLTQLMDQIKALEGKKKQISETFQKYKRNQLSQAKNWIN